jgi:hypothetical protein
VILPQLKEEEHQPYLSAVHWHTSLLCAILNAEMNSSSSKGMQTFQIPEVLGALQRMHSVSFQYAVHSGDLMQDTELKTLRIFS